MNGDRSHGAQIDVSSDPITEVCTSDRTSNITTVPTLTWNDIEACKDALTERQWEWVVCHVRDGKSLAEIHAVKTGIAKDVLTRHVLSNDHVLGKGCIRLLRSLLGMDIVIPSKGGAIESRANIAPQKIAWSDLSAFKEWFTEAQWSRVTAYYRDGYTLAVINGGTHFGKRDHVIGHASIRLLRLLLGLRVHSPRTDRSHECRPTGHGFNVDPNKEPVLEAQKRGPPERGVDGHDFTSE